MTDCKLFFDGEAGSGNVVFRCFVCGESIVVPGRVGAKVAKNCPKAPTALGMAVGFAEAVAKYVASGMADVTEAEYLQRGEICQACPIYDVASESCGKCGCTVGGKERLIDKRRMATEHCPEGKW